MYKYFAQSRVYRLYALGMMISLCSACSDSGPRPSVADSWQLGKPQILRGGKTPEVIADHSKVSWADAFQFKGVDGETAPFIKIKSVCVSSTETLVEETDFQNSSLFPLSRILPVEAMQPDHGDINCRFFVKSRNSIGSTHQIVVGPMQLIDSKDGNLILHSGAQIIADFLSLNQTDLDALQSADRKPEVAQLLCTRFRTQKIAVRELGWARLFRVQMEDVVQTEFGMAPPTQAAFRQNCRIVAYDINSRESRLYTQSIRVEFPRPQIDVKWVWTPGAIENLAFNSTAISLEISNSSAAAVQIQLPTPETLLEVTPMYAQIFGIYRYRTSHLSGLWKGVSGSVVTLSPHQTIQVPLETHHRCLLLRESQPYANASETTGTDRLWALRTAIRSDAHLHLRTDPQVDEWVPLANLDTVLAPIRDIKFMGAYDAAVSPVRVADESRVRRCSGPDFTTGD